MDAKIILTNIESEKYEQIVRYAIANGKKINHPTNENIQRYVITSNNTVVDVAKKEVTIILKNTDNLNINTMF